MNAQDKIITIKQDTIECRIISIGAEQISYEQETANGYIVGEIIPINQVKTYLRLPQSSSSFFSQHPNQPWIFRISSGGSTMPWLLEDTEDASSYGRKIARGFHVNASSHYLFNPYFGMGVQYSFFQSKVEGKYPVSDYSGSFIYSMLSEKDKQYVNYIGVSLISQQFLDKNKRFQLSEMLSGGMLFYRVESRSSLLYPSPDSYYTYDSNSLITGHSFGATLGLSVEYYVLPSLSIGLGGNFLFGLLKKVDIEQKDSFGYEEVIKGAELDKSLKVSRIDYSLSVSVHF
ncbi:hypothetical protein LJC52_00140 [Bacteroidales bacterium OttesenSCG-928-A17]|nr:hypothetical protein [Bacteroidales bacterium OttesenSCG-928-A17]